MLVESAKSNAQYYFQHTELLFSKYRTQTGT